MKNAVLIICILVAFVAGFALGWGKKPHEITIQLRSDLPKPLPVLQQNDVIHWLQPNGQPMTVTFPPGSPCNEGTSTTDCHVTSDRGLYPYHCDGCGDPVVPVGRSNGLNLAQTLIGGAYYDPLGVYCTKNNNSYVTSVPDQVAHVGDEFSWVPAGLDPPTSWTATFTDKTICADSAVFGSGVSDTGAPLPTRCKVIGSAGKTYTYTVESKVGTTVCSPYATASLKIE